METLSNLFICLSSSFRSAPFLLLLFTLFTLFRVSAMMTSLDSKAKQYYLVHILGNILYNTEQVLKYLCLCLGMGVSDQPDKMGKEKKRLIIINY